MFQIELIDRVDDIYRNTSWGEGFSGYGVQIDQVSMLCSASCLCLNSDAVIFNVTPRSCHQIIIKKYPTPVDPGKTHFNMKGSPVEGRDVWDVKKLLEVTTRKLTLTRHRVTVSIFRFRETGLRFRSEHWIFVKTTFNLKRNSLV